MGRVPGAILFSGIRGTGKTTLARLYARALNCEDLISSGDLCGQCPSCREETDTHPSIIERDAATHNGVDDIRDLNSLLQQVVLHRYRVVILDECHMLSKQAQAALLKILEEPPPNTVFLMVTTDPQKLESTIRSRCIQAPLRTLTSVDVATNVRNILQAEGKQYTEDFVEQLSMLGGGSLRDVQQLLEGLVLAAGDDVVGLELLRDSVGVISTQEYGELAEVLDHRNLRFFLQEIRRWYSEGRDVRFLFMEGIPVLLRDFMIFLSGVPAGTVEMHTGLSYGSLSCNLRLQLSDVRRVAHEWEVTMEFMRYTLNPVVIWSMFAAKVCCEYDQTTLA